MKHEQGTALPWRLDPSRTAMILTHPEGQQLVFGLDWSPLVGMNPRGQSRKRSRALRATHFVYSGTGARALGTTRLKSSQYTRKKHVHSAAAHYSQRNPQGAHACLIPFEGHGCWMVACHAGTVLANTDRWFEDLDAAFEAIKPIQNRFPFLQIETEPTLTPQVMPAWLTEKLTATSRLQPVKRLAGKVCAIALFFLVLSGLGGYLKFQFEPKHVSLQIEETNPVQLWQTALQKLSGSIALHTHQDLLALTQTWQQVPVHPAGWKLRHIQCDSNVQAWNCAAHFDRQHRFSLNEDLEQHKPAQWGFQASPLESASWHWQVSHQQGTHDWAVTPDPQDWMTYLQRIGLGFEQIQVGTGAALSVPPPVDMRGEPVVRPRELPAWRLRSLNLKGPLRSIVLLEGLTVPVRWRRAKLDLGSLSGRAVASSSALNIELTGEIFETK